MDVFFKWVRKDFIYFMSIFTEKFTGNRHIFRMQDLDQMSNEMPSCCTCNRYFVDEGAKIECKHYRINLSKDRTFMRRLCQGIYNIRSEKKLPSLLDNAPKYLVGCVIQKRRLIFLIFNFR